jgi:hypothetical protein
MVNKQTNTDTRNWRPKDPILNDNDDLILTKIQEWKRGKCIENFGADSWSKLSPVQKAVVYGVFFGMCGWKPSCPVEWDRMYNPDSPTRKDFCFSGVALFLGREVEENAAKAVAFWRKAVLSFEPNSYYFLGLCHKLKQLFV